MEMNELQNTLLNEMQQLGITKVRVGKKGQALGNIKLKEGKLLYEKGFRYYFNPDDAFADALKNLNDSKETLKGWKDAAAKEFQTHLLYHNDDNKERIEQSWLWTSDITDSKVRTEKDEAGLLLTGNINQLRQFKSYANNHMRYCHGCYYDYTNDEVRQWIELFYDFCLFEAYDSFGEYYHNAIVD